LWTLKLKLKSGRHLTMDGRRKEVVGMGKIGKKTTNSRSLAKGGKKPIRIFLGKKKDTASSSAIMGKGKKRRHGGGVGRPQGNRSPGPNFDKKERKFPANSRGIGHY